MTGLPDEIETQRLLYAGAAAPAPAAEAWAPFLARLAALTRAEGVLLRLSAGGHGARAAWGAAPALAEASLERLRRERIYAQGELDLPGSAPLRVIRTTLRPEGSVWLAIARARDEFRALDGARLDQLAPHLAQAAEIRLALERERAGAARSAALARRLGAGWLRFDRAGRVIEADAAARALIAAAPPLRLAPEGWLEGVPDPAALRAALEAPGPGTQPLALPLAPGLAIALWREADGLVTGALRAPPAATTLPPERLAQALGVSRSEARLAAQLADGATLTEAARALGWTLETARSASKRLYARTGAHSQSALIRAVLASPVWLIGR